MYILFSIFLILALFFSVIFYFRKKKIICKICRMCTTEKEQRLNEVIEPFGFAYNLPQDIFTSRLDAMQRDFGYTALYDNGAAMFNMLFDCEPVYFNYEGKTWLIEFWKGQYGINTGAEIGIYYADRIISPEDRSKEVFMPVEDNELFPMALQLFKNNRPLFYTEQNHWWLTGFSMGRFNDPDHLTAKLALQFPTYEMLAVFCDALTAKGYTGADFYTSERCLYLYFTHPKSVCPCRKHRFFNWLSRIENRIFCRLYLFATKPFEHTLDRLLLLYFHLPFAFRHMCKLKRF